MTISFAKKKFRNLREQILKDGKVDYIESEALLKFIEPYVRANSKKFTEFYRIIKTTQEDGQIDDQESKVLIAIINDIMWFLTVESLIENLILLAMSIGIIGFVISRIV